MGKSSLMRHQQSPFMREGNEGGGGGNQNQQGEPGQGQQQFRPIQSQEEFDRVVLDRIERAKREGFTQAETKYKPGHDRQTALEQELADAATKEKNQAVAEERSKFVPRVVRAEFKAAAKDAGLTKAQVDALLEDLDFSKYADDDGEPDVSKIEKKVKAFAPSESGSDKGKNNTGPDLGQGSGHQQSKPKPGEAGLAEAQRRFPQFQKTGS